MPFLNIIGVNSYNRSFYIAFAFLSSEGEKDYFWALDCYGEQRDIYRDEPLRLCALLTRIKKIKEKEELLEVRGRSLLIYGLRGSYP